MASSLGMLLIDDDPYVRVVLGSEVEESGRPVWATGCPTTAFAWAKEHEFEIALVDGASTQFFAMHVARRLRLEQPRLAIALLGAGAPQGEFPTIDRPDTIADFFESLRAFAANHAAGGRPSAGPAPAEPGDGVANESVLAQSDRGPRTRSVFDRLRMRLSA